jgi:hypothetical protein
MAAHDWDAMGQCLANDIVRVGPYCDTYRGRDDYVAFISALLPSLPGYRMEIDRVVYAASSAWVELSETVDVAGAPLRTPEGLVFDLNADALIDHIAVYIQTQPQS